MLFHANGASSSTRAQGAFVSDEEVEAIRDFFLQNQVTAPSYDESVLSEITGGGGRAPVKGATASRTTICSPDAVRLVVEAARPPFHDSTPTARRLSACGKALLIISEQKQIRE